MHRLGLLKRFAQWRRFQTTALVLSELECGASESELKEFHENLVISDAKSNDEADLPAKLSPADASVLSLFQLGNFDAVLSEDRIILKYCKAKGIVHYCCLSLLAPLVQSDLLTATEAKTLFPKIANSGRYSNKVIQIARDMLTQIIQKKTTE